jgi:RNA polymerase subunit RPABC4/transcription elongation factor Spt4
MAGLTICSACKRQITTDALTCPHCGHSHRQIGCVTGFLVILLVLIVVFFGLCSMLLHKD